MAAKVGTVNVSYGIGVQNRYSAFLEDEDGFGPPKVAPVVNLTKQRSESSTTKQKSLSNGSQKAGLAGNKLNGRAGAVNSISVKHEAQNKNSTQNESQRMNKGVDNRRPQQQRHVSANNGQVLRQGTNYGKPTNSDQEGNTANNRPTFRNQSNGNYHHQSNASHQHNNEANQQQGKPLRNNQRFNNRPRQFHNEERKVGHQQPAQESQVDVASGFATQSNEEEKRRRQQKRALDLRFKDPEKREARRQQQSTNVATSGEQAANSDNQAELAQGENNFSQRAQRNRRDGNRNQDETGRNFKGPRNRNRRPEGDTNGANAVNGGERRDGQQNRLGPRDRPQRNRNGFDAGSRNSRNGEDKVQERQRPIPNFSDKSDFPSLAS